MGLRGEEFTLAIVSLVLNVRKIMQSDSVQEGMKVAIRNDIRRLASRVDAANKIIRQSRK